MFRAGLAARASFYAENEMPKRQEQGPVELRVLMDCALGPKDSVVSAEDPDTALAWEAYGWADSHPDAVVYARSLAAQSA